MRGGSCSFLLLFTAAALYALTGPEASYWVQTPRKFGRAVKAQFAQLPLNASLPASTAEERGFEIHFASFADCSSADRFDHMSRNVRLKLFNINTHTKFTHLLNFTRSPVVTAAFRNIVSGKIRVSRRSPFHTHFSALCYAFASTLKQRLPSPTQQARDTGYFEAVHMQTLATLDADFARRNDGFVPRPGAGVNASTGLPIVRGCGYWLWKPQSILQAMRKARPRRVMPSPGAWVLVAQDPGPLVLAKAIGSPAEAPSARPLLS